MKRWLIAVAMFGSARVMDAHKAEARTLLSDAQVARYDALRGYAAR